MNKKSEKITFIFVFCENENGLFRLNAASEMDTCIKCIMKNGRLSLKNNKLIKSSWLSYIH